MATNNNFAGSNKVASAAEISNNNINNNNRESAGADLMGLIVAGHDAAKSAGHDDFVFDYGEYKVFVEKGILWTLSIYKNWRGIGDFDAELLDRRSFNYENSITYRWSKRVVNMAVALIEQTIADYETEQEQESIMERKYEQANEIIADAQESVNTIITDLELSIPSFDHIKTKIDAFAAKMMVQRVQEICNQCLIDCGEIFGCQMVEEDGFWPWVGNLESWGNGHNMESLIDTLDYMISGDSDMPLGLNAEDMEFINEGGCYCFDGYPMYIWQDLREFVNTYYHYNYCA